jgi:hypothetical protein
MVMGLAVEEDHFWGYIQAVFHVATSAEVRATQLTRPLLPFVIISVN